MRKRNLSVYDMQRELAAAGHTISVNSLTVLLREEGFSRLPRRADDERPVTVKPEIAAVADVRRLDLSPASFRTPLAGLFLFLPLLDRIDLQAVVTAAAFAHLADDPRGPGRPQSAGLETDRGRAQKSRHGPGERIGPSRCLRDINVVPKRSYLAAYSSRIDHKLCLRFMEAWLEQVEQAGLPHGSSFDLDFHSVPANSAEEPLEKHYVSSRSRSQKGILVFLARDAEQRVLRYANAGVTKGEQADEILQFVRFWKKHTGQAARRTGFRLATHHLPQALGVEPGRHLLHHPAPTFGKDVARDLQSTGFCLAADQLAGADPHLSQSQSAGEPRDPSRL